MHTGRNYTIKEVLYWTRRDILGLLVIAAVPTICYKIFGWTWLALPWLPIALLGTAVAFVVGFKNNASYDRAWEARKAWGAIVNASRGWGIMLKDYITNKQALHPLSEKELLAIKVGFINRHFAYLAALRYSLREPRAWEAITKKHNAEYKDKWFSVSEQPGDLRKELSNYLSSEEVEFVMTKTNKAAQIISMQSDQLRKLLEEGFIEDFRHIELKKILLEFYNQQGVSERIKNFPYPRQYATLNLYFTKIFVCLIPLGMLREFDNMGDHFFWLAIPFSALSGWIFTTLEKIGESTENPLEGSAYDVPITAISRNIEIDLKEMFGMENIPSPLKPQNNILV